MTAPRRLPPLLQTIIHMALASHGGCRYPPLCTFARKPSLQKEMARLQTRLTP